jgi:hypothetical protein
MIVTLISISHLSSPPLIPNVKCIAWNFDGSNIVSNEDKKEDLKRLRFENGDTIPDVECYFVSSVAPVMDDDYDNDDDDDDDDDSDDDDDDDDDDE